MAHISEDRVLETATANTTVSFTTTGAITGFRTFASQLATNDTCFYVAQEVDANGTPTGNWENGLGTYSAANTLTRTTVLESSNAGAAVTFGAGTVQVAIGLLAMRSLQYDNNRNIWLQGATAEPPTPPADNLYLYARTIAPGLTLLKVKRPSGIDSPLQDAILFNRLIRYQSSGAALAAIGGAALTAVGTQTAVVVTSGSAKNHISRTQNASAATAGALASYHCNNVGIAAVMRGGVAGEGGFRFITRFALNALQAGNRGFFGLSDVASAPTNVDPLTNTTPGKIGIAFNANTGNFTFVHNVTGTAPTQIALGANFPINTTDLYEVLLVAHPFGTVAGNIGYRIRRYTTASDTPAQETSGTLTTNIPAATTLLHPVAWMTNNATAAAVSFHINSIGIETDF